MHPRRVVEVHPGAMGVFGNFLLLWTCAAAFSMSDIVLAQAPFHPASPAKTTPLVEDGDAVAVRPRRLEVQPPSMFQVVLLNDDFTPMEFVVLILQDFFGKDRQAATSIMLKVHTEGRGICGVFTRDIAETKTGQVMEAARAAGHPLQCVCEPVE